MNPISFRKVGNIPSAPSGCSLVTCAVTNSRTGLFLFTDIETQEKVKETVQRGAIVPKSRMDFSERFVLVELANGQEREHELPPLDVTFPLVDRFPDGRFFIASSRSQWRSECDFDSNGVVIDLNANQVDRILLGDGIEQLAIDRLSRVWVSYFDEGIYGNLGWGRPGPEPIGSHGLNCFESDGSLLWSFPYDGPYGPISDCYALNVVEDKVFAYFYTKFPLCRIDTRFQTTYWELGLAGCDQFAVDESSVLLSRQDRGSPRTFHYATFLDGELSRTKQLDIRLPDGQRISEGQLIGRGDELNLFLDGVWYRVSLGEIQGLASV